MAEIYEPAEDSYLISGALASQLPPLLKKKPELTFLEVGCGSGINLRTAFGAGVKKQNILGSDINKAAIAHCKKLGFNAIESYLFEKIKRKFDVIAFNPPYLPLDEDEPRRSRKATTGGLKGHEIILLFLYQAKKHLNRNGKIFLLTSSLTPEINFKDEGYKSELLAQEKLFMEKLFVFLLTIA